MNDTNSLRSIPLLSVLSLLGVQTTWKTRKGGTEHFGTCPLHTAKRNATSFSMDSEGRYHCFSCGAKGKGAIDFVMAFKKVGFQEAVQWLQSQQGNHASLSQRSNECSPLHKEGQEPVLENPTYKSSYEKFKVESDWLKERGFTAETLEHFGVFEYNNPKRRSPYNGSVLISIRRFLDGEVVGYLARETLGRPEVPKYLWPKGVSKSLEVFGAWNLKRTQQLPLRVGYLVESPFAVMKFHQLGFHAVSCFGWSTSNEQCLILSQLAKGWVFLPDADKRIEAIQQVAPVLVQRSWMKCPEFPGTDPEHLTEQQIRALA